MSLTLALERNPTLAVTFWGGSHNELAAIYARYPFQPVLTRSSKFSLNAHNVKIAVFINRDPIFSHTPGGGWTRGLTKFTLFGTDDVIISKCAQSITKKYTLCMCTCV